MQNGESSSLFTAFAKRPIERLFVARTGFGGGIEPDRDEGGYLKEGSNDKRPDRVTGWDRLLRRALPLAEGLNP